MDTLNDTITRAFSSSITPWLLVGTCIALALHSFVRSRKLLIRLPGPPPQAGGFLTGHFADMMGPDGLEVRKSFLVKYGPTIQLNGSLREEIIYTADPALMHAVLVKDKAKFERGKGLNLLLHSLFGGGLPALEGEEHRVHRKLLNPVFTMKFLHELMPTFLDIANQTCQGIQRSFASSGNSPKIVDIFPWATHAALELIGEAGLGYSFGSFTGKRNKYNVAIKAVTEAIGTVNAFASLLPYLYRIGTPAFRRWMLQNNPWATIRQIYHAVDVQNAQANEVLRNRQALIDAGDDLSSQAGRGRDLLTLLMKANEGTGSEFHINREAMIGHMNLFIFAGHETTSTAVARILDQLSTYQDVQNKLRDEISRYFQENMSNTHHDGLLELPYLDAVVRETLCLYGPGPMLARECVEDTWVPLMFPIDTPSGKITSILVKKGDRVLLNIAMSGRYEKIWGKQAEEFLPERWMRAKLDEVTEPGVHLPGVYSSMMTFGAGSTSCIGFKFAVMELKVMIAQLVKSFRFEPADEVYWQPTQVYLPFLKAERDLPEKVPKLPLKVTRL